MEKSCRHAYCIIAHEAPQRLALLVALIDDPRNDIFVLIDGHVDPAPFIDIVSADHSRISFLKDPPAVIWGDYSQIEATLRLISHAADAGPYARYHLLSGADMPVKDQDYIHRYCDDLFPDEQFVEYSADPADIADACRKMSVRNVFKKYARKTGHGLFGRTIGHWLNRSARDIQRHLGLTIRLPEGLAKGASWWSLTHEAVAYAMESEAWIKSAFSHALCPDEMFMQTVLRRAPHKFRIHAAGCMRLIDWERGYPYVWGCGDSEDLTGTDALFARKFHQDVSGEFICGIISSARKTPFHNIASGF